MKVLVYGAGVIGSVYAVRLAKAGNDVTVVARGDRLEAIRDGGLCIRHVFLDQEERADVAVAEGPDPADSYDVVLVTVRAGQVADALRSAAACESARAIAAIGNNIDGHAEQAAIAGASRFVLGFGSFGGYRDGPTVAYIDGRTPEKPGMETCRSTTLGVLEPDAAPALEAVASLVEQAGLPVQRTDRVRPWLVCHAALVFPLAGAIYACGGEQERTCRTRDALVLGVRSVRELLRALRHLDIPTEPRRLRSFVATPEPILVPVLGRLLATESSTVGVFGHANAPGGRSEIAGQAHVLDAVVREAHRPLPSWDRLLPHFETEVPPLPDGSREIRLRLW